MSNKLEHQENTRPFEDSVVSQYRKESSNMARAIGIYQAVCAGLMDGSMRYQSAVKYLRAAELMWQQRTVRDWEYDDAMLAVENTLAIELEAELAIGHA